VAQVDKMPSTCKWATDCLLELLTEGRCHPQLQILLPQHLLEVAVVRKRISLAVSRKVFGEALIN
jgi:hypothetical protein